MSRRASKVDANQGDVVKVFRGMGASVHLAHGAGEGFPDLVVGYANSSYLIEVKDGQKPSYDRQLTGPQVKWHKAWTGHVEIIKSVDEAVAFMNRLIRAEIIAGSKP